MTVRINLKNNNVEGGKLYLYRSTERFSEEALPQPLAVLASNAKSYDDDSFLLYDTDYYYGAVIESAAGEKSHLMPLRKVRLTHDVGVGCKDILSGDETLGYMGIVSSRDEGYGELWGASPYSPSSYSSFFSFIKYIRNGVISYTPTGQVTSTYSDLMYREGFLFGGTGADQLTANATMAATVENASKKYREINGRKYSCHIPVMFKSTDTFAANILSVDGGAVLLDLPPGENEAIDFWRMFGAQSPVADTKKVPAYFRTIGTGDSIIVTGTTNGSTSHYAGTLATTSVHSNPSFNSNSLTLNSNTSRLFSFIIEFDQVAE